VVTRYHISLDVADKPGVLAQVATVFAEHDVSIDTVRQQGRNQGSADTGAGEAAGAGEQAGGAVPGASPSGGWGRKGGEASLVVVTHRAPDAALSATVASLRELDTVRGVASIMRVEGE
jgi:homoserine dehydrogenase